MPAAENPALQLYPLLREWSQNIYASHIEMLKHYLDSQKQ